MTQDEFNKAMEDDGLDDQSIINRYVALCGRQETIIDNLREDLRQSRKEVRIVKSQMRSRVMEKIWKDEREKAMVNPSRTATTDILQRINELL